MTSKKSNNFLANSQSGMAIIYAILLVGAILAIVFALSAIAIPKIKLSGDIVHSAGALHAAESGAEWCLYIIYLAPSPLPPPPAMANGATLKNESEQALSETDCAAPTIKIYGTYKGVTRSYEITP